MYKNIAISATLSIFLFFTCFFLFDTAASNKMMIDIRTTTEIIDEDMINSITVSTPQIQNFNEPTPSLGINNLIASTPTPTPTPVYIATVYTSTPTPGPGTFDRAREYMEDKLDNYILNGDFAGDGAKFLLNEVNDELKARSEQSPFASGPLLEYKYFQMYENRMKNELANGIQDTLGLLPSGKGSGIQSEEDHFEIKLYFGPVVIQPGKSLTSHATKVVQNMFSENNPDFQVKSKYFIDNSYKTEIEFSASYSHDVVTSDGSVKDEFEVKIGVTIFKP